MNVQDIIRENDRRNSVINSIFNPITGEGSIGERIQLSLPDHPIPIQWIPKELCQNPLIRKLIKARSIDAFIRQHISAEPTFEIRNIIIDKISRIRMAHDFAYWAAMYVKIKNKSIDGDPEILFRLTYPQRKFVSALEDMRLAKKPIRLVLLKARQWGGSTTSQLYMAWLQLTHKQGLNSLIIAHQGTASDEIKDMFDRAIKAYPTKLMHPLGASFNPDEPKMIGVGKSGSIFRIPQRDCKVKIGTAERPDSCRGGDYALVHLSEVGIWKETEGKKPTDIVRSACAGVVNRPGTMIVYESTANGHGNFFHAEYMDARDNPKSAFKALFIPWYDIDWNVIQFCSSDALNAFAEELLLRKDNPLEPSRREESGKYLWSLWERGATLEAINWYICERAKHSSHGAMAAECPSDDVEAFVNSGSSVFDKYLVEQLRKTCRKPIAVGEVFADADQGADALANIRFKDDSAGCLHIWQHPEPTTADTLITHRYLTVVDIGGRSAKADYTVIAVLDRIGMIDGEPPAIVAQWRGHCDVDIIAWKAAQIASYYDNSLLVIESNTLETREKTRAVDGDQSTFILNQLKDCYDNLYARKQSEDDIRNHIPRKYGFHTNTHTKPMIISGLIKYVRESAWDEADSRCLDELLNYERKPNGSFGAIAGYHDDILMTRAIGLHICFREMDMPEILDPSKTKNIYHERVSMAQF